MVGRLAYQKRPDLAVRAVNELRRRVEYAHLLIVGDGPQHDELQALIADLGLGDAVYLLGRREDVPRLLAHASCFLLTSRYEGCPLSVLEAMATGLPVVATRMGGIDEVVSDGRSGLIVEAQPGAIADALAALLSDPEFSTRMGAEARRVVQRRFSRSRMAAETVAIWEAAAESRSRWSRRGGR